MHGRISFIQEEFFLVTYQEDEFSDHQLIGLIKSEKEAKKLCSVLSEEDERPIENYTVSTLTAYESHEDFLNEEQGESF